MIFCTSTGRNILSHLWPVGASSGCLLSLFDMSLGVFNSYFDFSYDKTFWAHTAHLSKKCRFLLLWEKLFRKKTLGDRHAHCYWGAHCFQAISVEGAKVCR